MGPTILRKLKCKPHRRVGELSAGTGHSRWTTCAIPRSPFTYRIPPLDTFPVYSTSFDPLKVFNLFEIMNSLKPLRSSDCKCGSVPVWGCVCVWCSCTANGFHDWFKGWGGGEMDEKYAGWRCVASANCNNKTVECEIQCCRQPKEFAVLFQEFILPFCFAWLCGILLVKFK